MPHAHRRSARLWVKGNFDVWGTYPRDDIAVAQSFANTFQGCDRALLEGGRRVMFLSYCMLAIACVPLCTVCCTMCAMVAAAAREVEFEARTDEREMV